MAITRNVRVMLIEQDINRKTDPEPKRINSKTPKYQTLMP